MEGVSLALGAAVVKSALKLWLGDRPLAADASASAVDVLVGRASDALEKRRTKRLFDQLEEAVAGEALARLPDRCAYLSLWMSGRGESQRAVAAVEASPRLLVRGEAGSAKTTLLSEERRAEVRRWLEQLVAMVPHARYLVTSRLAAIEANRLEEKGFSVADRQPMSPADTQAFVHRWHEAMRSRERLDLLEVACLATSPDLDPTLRKQIQRRTSWDCFDPDDYARVEGAMAARPIRLLEERGVAVSWRPAT